MKFIVPENYILVSFDVTSLFTNVPLEQTIKIILKRIYEIKEITTDIKKDDMKKLLYLCTKEVHFSFNGKIYIQNDGVVMGSPLGPVLANIFMVELEKTVIPTLKNYLYCWKRYVDDTFTIIDRNQVHTVKDNINNFHPEIKFTHEEEQNGKISFLDVQITNRLGILQSEVYRKPTSSDIFLQWNSFTPLQWKTSTLKTLVLRAYTVSSDNILLQKELDYLRQIFHQKNGYPIQFIDKVIASVDKNNQTALRENDMIPGEELNLKKVSLTLPYMGKKGEQITKKMKKQLKRLLPNNIETRTINTTNKVSSYFNIKDPIQKHHRHDIIYEYKCNDIYCNEMNII